MCREVRRIYFSNCELIDALSFFCETSHQCFPFSEAADLTFTEGPELIATVSEPARSAETSEFAESEIAVALILHCKHLGIPLARRAEKSLELKNDNIVFVMRISEPPVTARVVSAKAVSA